MSKSQTNNGTMKFTDIDPKKIIIDNVSYDGVTIPLLKLGTKDTFCTFQAPRILMSDYGINPGEFLANGKENQYYRKDEARDIMKFPLDADKCCVTLKDGTTNKNEIASFIEFLKAIDAHIKSSESIRKAAGIDDDNIEKYYPIFRKAPKPIKKVQDKNKQEPKIKPSYMKTKFAMDHNNKKEMRFLTEFYNVNRETNETSRVITNSNYLTLEDLEKFYEYKCEQQPVIQLVKIWSKATGEWGVTLKLIKSRFWKSNKANKSVDFGFIDDDCETKQDHVEKKADVPSDDSDEEPTKPTVKSSVKKNVKEDSDSEVVPVKELSKQQDSDSEEVVPVKKLPKQPVKHNDSDSDESVKEPVKKPVKQPVKKDVESDDSDDEVVPVRRPPVKGGKSKK